MVWVDGAGAILDLLAMPMRSGTAKRATLTNANAEAPTFAEAVCTQSVCRCVCAQCVCSAYAVHMQCICGADTVYAHV